MTSIYNSLGTSLKRAYFWRKLSNLIKIRPIPTIFAKEGFAETLITNMEADLPSSKWRIQDGERNFKKSYRFLKEFLYWDFCVSLLRI